MTKKYVAIIYDDATQNNLRKWATQSGFDLGYGYGGEPKDPSEYEFHTTVFYTSNDVDHKEQEPGYNLIETHEVRPVAFDTLGMEKNIPVIKVEPTGALGMLRKKYEALGYQDQWDNYVPHISLSYARKPVDLSLRKLPTFPLTFSYVKVEDLMEK